MTVYYLYLIKVLGAWTKLPLIQAKHVQACRLMNPILTGDLESEIDSFPIFPGKEKHLLKALLVRISYGTSIVPKGLYKTQEEKGIFLIRNRNRI